METTVSEKLGIERGIVGTMNEVRVAADLLQRGYYVFRNMSYFGPFDLFAYHKAERTQLRIEVAGGRLCKSGVSFDPHTEAEEHFDVIAVATPTEIIYVPNLPTTVAGGLCDCRLCCQTANAESERASCF